MMPRTYLNLDPNILCAFFLGSNNDAEEKLEMKRRVLQYQNEVDFQKSEGIKAFRR